MTTALLSKTLSEPEVDALFHFANVGRNGVVLSAIGPTISGFQPMTIIRLVARGYLFGRANRLFVTDAGRQRAEELYVDQASKRFSA